MALALRRAACLWGSLLQEEFWVWWYTTSLTLNPKGARWPNQSTASRWLPGAALTAQNQFLMGEELQIPSCSFFGHRTTARGSSRETASSRGEAAGF